MTKTQKKIDNLLCKSLTELCEDHFKTFSGFLWVTHLIDFNRYPQSLKIILVFDTDENLQNFTCQIHVENLLSQMFTVNNIPVTDPKKHIAFDTQQACDSQHRGNWQARFRMH